MVLHGRYTCTAKQPKCDRCILADLCPRQGVNHVETENLPLQSVTIQEPSWQQALASEMQQPYFTDLMSFVDRERLEKTVFPPPEDVFTAFELTPLDRIKVVILGQDPYHGLGQAHGLSFSVKSGVSLPPSLVNIFKELNSDLGISIPEPGELSKWARQGVLLLNTVLTVRTGEPNSHKDRGWEKFTDATIKLINENCDRVIFVLWGRPAQKKAKLIDDKKHFILTSAHPSPLSAHNGFFGSRPFSQINKLLEEDGREAIDWKL
jgi:uracil-DNA glycosylase